MGQVKLTRGQTSRIRLVEGKVARAYRAQKPATRSPVIAQIAIRYFMSDISEALMILRLLSCQKLKHWASGTAVDLSRLVYASGVVALCMHALVRCETNSNFGFCSDSSGENRFELSKATFADSHDRRNTLEQP